MGWDSPGSRIVSTYISYKQQISHKAYIFSLVILEIALYTQRKFSINLSSCVCLPSFCARVLQWELLEKAQCLRIEIKNLILLTISLFVISQCAPDIYLNAFSPESFEGKGQFLISQHWVI